MTSETMTSFSLIILNTFDCFPIIPSTSKLCFSLGCQGVMATAEFLCVLMMCPCLSACAWGSFCASAAGTYVPVCA